LRTGATPGPIMPLFHLCRRSTSVQFYIFVSDFRTSFVSRFFFFRAPWSLLHASVSACFPPSPSLLTSEIPSSLRRILTESRTPGLGTYRRLYKAWMRISESGLVDSRWPRLCHRTCASFIRLRSRPAVEPMREMIVCHRYKKKASSNSGDDSLEQNVVPVFLSFSVNICPNSRGFNLD